jgi:hypothetical protein
MAENPFAKFATQADESQQNPFAKFATQPSEIPARRTYAGTEVPGEAMRNLPASATEYATDFLQMLTSPVETVKGVAKLGAGVTAKGLSLLPESIQQAAMLEPLIGPVTGLTQPEIQKAQQQALQPAIEMANAIGGIYKDRYGDWESVKRTMAEDPVGALADLSSLLTGGGAAVSKLPVVGKAGSAVSKVGDIIDPTRPLTAAVKAPFAVGGYAAETIRNALDPKSYAYLQAAGGQGEEILNALAQSSEIIPGSLPTAAQAASPVGSTGFSALGASSAKVLPDEYYARMGEQKAAQTGTLGQIAQTPEALQAATVARSQAAGPFFSAADQQVLQARTPKFEMQPSGLLDARGQPIMTQVMTGYDLTPELKALTNRPAIEQAFQAAVVNAKNQNVPFFKKDGTMTGNAAYSVKLALDSMLTPTPGTPFDMESAKAVRKAKDAYVAWLEKNVPDYEVARKTFAENSPPINQIEVGQYLERKLVPALGEETASLRAEGFARAMEDAPTLIKRSTGESRYKQLTEIMTPEQMKILNDIKADLARAKITDVQAKAAGSKSVDLLKVGTETMQDIRAPNLLQTVTTVANNILSRLAGNIDRKMAIEIATEMLYPEKAAAALRKALTKQVKYEAVMDPFRKAGRAAQVPMRTPGLVNIAPEILNNLSNQTQEETPNAFLMYR